MKRIALLLLVASTSYAAAPLWTFTPLTATQISVPSSGSATVQYLVTNQSSKSHTLDMKPIQGISQITVSSLCTDPFVLAGKQSCVLSLNVDGAQLAGNVVGGPVVCEQGNSLQCYQPSAQDSLNITLDPVSSTTTLSVSLSQLALATSGLTRQITITNVGSYTAENLVNVYEAVPPGTFIVSTCGSTLIPSGSCTVSVTPGVNATSNCNAGQGSAPIPAMISVSADNSNTVTTGVVVLTYGCIYQEGYIFAIDDTTSTNMSIGGSTVGLEDMVIGSPPYMWGTFGVLTNATSLTDGPGNTAAIVSAEPPSSFAAQVCNDFEIDSSGITPCATGTCYTGWYLPAVCQMGATGGSAGCPVGVPNIEDNLQSLITGCSGSECLSAEHWSSTEFSTLGAWYVYFQPSASTIQQQTLKPIAYPVRCARNF